MTFLGLYLAFLVFSFGFLALAWVWSDTGGNLVDDLIDLTLRTLFSYRDIRKPDGSLYLRRFYITPHKWLGFTSGGESRWPRWLGFVPVALRKIFVHRILQSDERTMHDHPWPFVSFLFRGSYLEHTPGGSALAKRGNVLERSAHHIHRLEIVRPVWSLVFAGEAFRDWGFWPSPYIWVAWRQFLDCPEAETEPEDQYKNEIVRERANRQATSTASMGNAVPIDLSEDVPMDWDTGELETVPDISASARARSVEDDLGKVFGSAHERPSTDRGY